MNTPKTLSGLLDVLVDEEQLGSQERIHVEVSMDLAPRVPLVVHILSGLGGIFASALLVFAVCILLISTSSGDVEGLSGFFGAFGLLATIIFQRTSMKDASMQSLRMAVLATSLTSMGLVLFGFGASHAMDGDVMLLLASFLGVILYMANNDIVHRYLMSIQACQCLIFYAYVKECSWVGYAVATLSVVLLVTAFACFHRIGRKLYMIEPALYGLVSTIITMSVLAATYTTVPIYEPYFRIVLAAAILVVAFLVSREHLETRAPLKWCIVVAVWFAIISNAGVLAGILLVILGFWRTRRIYTLVGINSIICFLIYFYYSIEGSLFSKSFVLFGSGVILLAVRAWLHRQPWMQALLESSEDEVLMKEAA